jgi:hypothetical protein
MSLSEIASDLKSRALTAPTTDQAHIFPGGAKAFLRAVVVDEETTEYHLKIQRRGILPEPGTRGETLWLRELRTFRAVAYFNVPTNVEAEMKQGKESYAAIFVWRETVSAQMTLSDSVLEDS